MLCTQGTRYTRETESWSSWDSPPMSQLHTQPLSPSCPLSPGLQHGAAQPPAALAAQDLHPQVDLPLHLLVRVHLAEAHPATVSCGKRGDPHGGVIGEPLRTSLSKGWEMGPCWDPPATLSPTLGVLCQHVPGDADLPNKVITAGKQKWEAGHGMRLVPRQDSPRFGGSWTGATTVHLSPWSTSATHPLLPAGQRPRELTSPICVPKPRAAWPGVDSLLSTLGLSMQGTKATNRVPRPSPHRT